MKRLILIFFFLTGCTYKVIENPSKTSQISFSEDLSLEQFRVKLEQYSTNNTYPNIDN